MNPITENSKSTCDMDPIISTQKKVILICSLKNSKNNILIPQIFLKWAERITTCLDLKYFDGAIFLTENTSKAYFL